MLKVIGSKSQSPANSKFFNKVRLSNIQVSIIG